MSQLRRIYQSIKSNNPTLSDGKARQQAWIIRDKMLFENTAVSSSSAAGGAGGGGRKKVTVPTIESITGLSYLITWIDPDTDTHKFFVFNHSTGTLSTTIDAELINDSNNEWVLDQITSVQEKGFLMLFSNSNLGNIDKLYYIDFNGNIIDTKDLDYLPSLENLYSNVLIYGTLNELTFIYTFDGEKVTTYQLDRPFEQLSIFGISKNNKILVIDLQEDLFEQVPTAYIGLSDGTLLSVPDLLGEQLLDLNNNFISTIDSKNYINIVSEEGALLNTYDLTGKGIKNWSSSAYGENSVYYLLDDGTTAEMVAYDGDSNQFSSFTFSIEEIATRPTYYSKKEWTSPIPSFGTTLTQVGISGGFFQDSTGRGYSGTTFDIWWLPKGQTEFLQHSLSNLDEVYFQDPNAEDGTRLSFTNGVNPVIIFSTQSSPIYVGFLTDTGFVTQSTGVNMDNLAGAGVYGGKVGDYTYAGYNQNNDNITWQIYGESSILETFTTSINFTVGDSSRTSNMNGTLIVLDTSGDASASYPSYVYTTEIGLQEVFLENGDVWNSTTYGNRTGLASEFQIITQASETGDITGFYLLSKSGLYQLKDITPLLEGDNHTINQVSIGDEMISFNLSGASTVVIKESFDFSGTFKSFPPAPGNYQGVEALTNGSGTGLLLDVVVTGPDDSGIFVITATLVDGGSGFGIYDYVYLDTQTLGGSGSDNTPSYQLQEADIAGYYNRTLTFNKSTLDLITNLKQIDPSVYFYNDRVIVENFDESNTIFTFLYPGGSIQTTINSNRGSYESNDSIDNSN